MRGILLRTPSPLPGFGPAFALMTTALALVVLGPLAALLARGLEAGPAAFWAEVTAPRTLAALGLSFRAALVAAARNQPRGRARAGGGCRERVPGGRRGGAARVGRGALP
ncbi:MAG: sulfate ABC transporter permease subunit CysT, partial [Pseudomonadota bacterium]|nr:sulfate ABC transporter permease subunit CysT [Pseudomonadota bacterium]